MKKSILSTIRKKPLAHAIGFALAANAIGVFAQETDATEALQKKDEEKIVITGSRIRSGGFDEARPVDIIVADSAINQGLSDIGALLRNSTVASGSAQVTAASSTAFVQNGGEGTETLSLRGLGANRTLTLLNGRRAGPAGTRGGVSSFDFNVLPLSIVERVEILKDGASSVYGSDAVAGVINVISVNDTVVVLIVVNSMYLIKILAPELTLLTQEQTKLGVMTYYGDRFGYMTTKVRAAMWPQVVKPNMTTMVI